ncbi:ceramidase domain-containing protein [Rufibacter sp. LB8]|uniref:ceramidase domain-containing protein n=1 Tax=Rufibacter sp. LB8 TaxID=2777781 RepID=UPI00178C4DA6|nr:ceramidase domain-containing protein [Rufibacter sp. LB8]
MTVFDPHRYQKIGVLLLLVTAAVVGVFLVDPIPQDLAYHAFADGQTHVGIPNFWNVLSNLPFMVVGLYCVMRLYQGNPKGLMKGTKTGYQLFFAGIFFTGLGSAYYHLAPDNHTLLWDRLPMTIAFMGFFSVVVSEYIHLKAGQRLLVPLVVLGLLSVGYWYVTEQDGHGDLRFYVLVQFLPILLTPLILLLFKSPFSTNAYTWYVVLAYALAKVLETFDQEIFAFTGQLMSGHALKHVLAAAAPWFLFLGLYKRSIKP